MSAEPRKRKPEPTVQPSTKPEPAAEPPAKTRTTHPVTDLPEAYWKSAAKFQRLR